MNTEIRKIVNELGPVTVDDPKGLTGVTVTIHKEYCILEIPGIVSEYDDVEYIEILSEYQDESLVVYGEKLGPTWGIQNEEHVSRYREMSLSDVISAIEVLEQVRNGNVKRYSVDGTWIVIGDGVSGGNNIYINPGMKLLNVGERSHAIMYETVPFSFFAAHVKIVEELLNSENIKTAKEILNSAGYKHSYEG